MDQLSSIDASFLHLETPETPMHGFPSYGFLTLALTLHCPKLLQPSAFPASEP